MADWVSRKSPPIVLCGSVSRHSGPPRLPGHMSASLYVNFTKPPSSEYADQQWTPHQISAPENLAPPPSQRRHRPCENRSRAKPQQSPSPTKHTANRSRHPNLASLAAPYVNGQFSNGNVWVQDLAGDLGLGPMTPGLLGSTDYAVGGAETSVTPFNLPTSSAGSDLLTHSCLSLSRLMPRPTPTRCRPSGSVPMICVAFSRTQHSLKMSVSSAKRAPMGRRPTPSIAD